MPSSASNQASTLIPRVLIYWAHPSLTPFDADLSEILSGLAVEAPMKTELRRSSDVR